MKVSELKVGEVYYPGNGTQTVVFIGKEEGGLYVFRSPHWRPEDDICRECGGTGRVEHVQRVGVRSLRALKKVQS